MIINKFFAIVVVLFLLVIDAYSVEIKNLLPNASFEIETVDGNPDYFDHYLGPKKVVNWFDLWTLDNTTAYHGNKSMRLEVLDENAKNKVQLNPALIEKSIIRKRNWKAFERSQSYVFSVYLKSSTPDLKVTVSFLSSATKIVVGTTWKRFHFVGNARKKIPVRFSIQPQSRGVLWVDAVQVEEGCCLPTPFQTSEYDIEIRQRPQSETVGKIKQRLRNLSTLPPLFEIVPDRSFYSTEENINITMKWNKKFDPDRSIEVQGNIYKETQENAIEYSFSKIVSDMETNTITIPSSLISPGRKVVRLKLLDRRSTLAEAHSSLTKLQPKINEVKIDHQKRCLLINNEPFFMFGACFQRVFELPPSRVEQLLAKLKTHGYTVVIPTFTSYLSDYRSNDEEIIWFCDKAVEKGLKIIPWISPNAIKSAQGQWQRVKSNKEYRQIINAYKIEFKRLYDLLQNHPGLLAWYVADEPKSLIDKDFANHIVSFTKQTDPYHPVFINFASHLAREYFRRGKAISGDIISHSVYPIPYHPVTNAAYFVKMEKIVSNNIKPVVLWLQYYGGSGRYPTPKEFDSMVYLAAIHGATGFNTWPIMPSSKTLWEQAARSIFEMSLLSEVLYSDEADMEIRCSSDNIHYSKRIFGNRLYLIAVNPSQNHNRVTFNLRDKTRYSSICSVQFEDRSLGLRDGQLIDHFAPFQRHVYVFQVLEQF